ITVVRLDERVLRQLPAPAVVEKLRERAENLRLILQDVDHFERGADLIVVVQLRRAAGGNEPRVDAPELRAQVEEVHADLAERGSVVRERPVAEGRPRD